MANGIKIKNLGVFQSTLKEYMKHTKRDLNTVLDTKAFYIARGAVRETLSPSKQKIANELNEDSGINPEAPLGAIIINARRGKRGLRGLYGKAMRDAFKSLINARVRSRRFIASGWLGPIKDLEPFAEQKNRAPRKDSSVKQYGKVKGNASPAGRKETWTPRAILRNLASANKDLKAALITYGLPAFETAWNAEIASMKQYIEDKMAKTAKQRGMTRN